MATLVVWSVFRRQFTFHGFDSDVIINKDTTKSSDELFRISPASDDCPSDGRRPVLLDRTLHTIFLFGLTFRHHDSGKLSTPISALAACYKIIYI